MPKFYIKNDSDEYVDGTSAVEEYFRERSDDIVRKRMAGAKDKITSEVRAEIEAEVRKSATEAIKEEVRKEIEPEYKDKLAEAEARVKTLDTSLRRKTIAAEYGLKAEFEEFLGDGSDEDMRAKADVLKTSPVNSGETKAPEKQGKPDSSDSFVKFIGDTD